MVNDKHKIIVQLFQKVGPPKPDAVFSKCFNGSILSSLKEIFNTLEDMSDSIVANNRFVYKNCYLLRRFRHCLNSLHQVVGGYWVNVIMKIVKIEGPRRVRSTAAG